MYVANNSATVAQPTTKTVDARQRQIAERGQSPRLSRTVIAALVGLGIVLIAGAAVVFHIATDRGGLIVVSDDPGVEVFIKRGEHVVGNLQLERGKTKTTIRSGEYVIELHGVSADRYTLDREQITISRGDSLVVTVTRRQAGRMAEGPGPLPADSPLPAASPMICKTPIPRAILPAKDSLVGKSSPDWKTWNQSYFQVCRLAMRASSRFTGLYPCDPATKLRPASAR